MIGPLRKPGYYIDSTNGDMWRLETCEKHHHEIWEWVNGLHWNFIPTTLKFWTD